LGVVDLIPSPKPALHCVAEVWVGRQDLLMVGCWGFCAQGMNKNVMIVLIVERFQEGVAHYS
jgi:hypothetical protein